jgi:hypothetical protein
MKLFTTIIALLFCNFLSAQENGLNFDNVDDKIEVANASALITNTSNISMSFWVKPMNTNPTYPDLDGFCGFRNDVDCDFYIVQLNATDVEARFRNSAGTAFSLTSTTLILNQWQHYVFTYDGSMLRLYHNGTFTDSLAANGTLLNTTQPLNIGNLLYSITDFFLNGSMDEVSLWNTTLSQADIDCIFKSYVDSTASGLLLYYKFNQGIAMGTNTGIDTLVPSAGNLPGTLFNFNLNGITSNWISGLQNFYQITDVFCPNTPYTFGSQTLAQPGVYYEYYTGADGCDSIQRLNLYSIISDSVSVYADSMLAFQLNGTYQWLDCDNNNSAIPAATSRGYAPPAAGNYSVEVTYNNCVDTSECINFIPTNVNAIRAESLKLISNPVTGYITFNESLINENIIITDLEGKLAGEMKNVSGKSIDVSYLNSGTYIITIKSAQFQKTFRFVKNR